MTIYGTQSWNAATGFSQTQGQNQRYYEQWNGTSYSNMAWDAVNNRWQGSQSFCLVMPDAQHPDVYDSVRKWVASKSQTIRITGDVRKYNTANGDGVIVRIMKNDAVIWGPAAIAYNDSIGLSHDIMVNVAAGDSIRFIVNKNGDTYSDGTAWDPVITDAGILKPGTTWTASKGFGAVQGQNQWYCQQRDGSSYSNMLWDASNSRWAGSQSFCRISADTQHPDTADSVRKWVAPQHMSLRIQGNVKKYNTSGGDGIIATILRGRSETCYC